MNIKHSNYLGIDYGSARVGIALAEGGVAVARPLTTLDQPVELMSGLQQLVDQHSVDAIVVGLPRGLDGQETAQTAAARQFAAQLESLGCAVHLQDEAATSSVARERLGPQPKGQLDAQAAAIILQDYLDQQPVHGA